MSAELRLYVTQYIHIPVYRYLYISMFYMIKYHYLYTTPYPKPFEVSPKKACYEYG